eukprot:2153450-Pyramimonas_sp.AAC.1
MHGEPDAVSAGQPAVALLMPKERRQFWEQLRTAHRVKINPAYKPFIDNGSGRYIVQCDVQCAAAVADDAARARQ